MGAPLSTGSCAVCKDSISASPVTCAACGLPHHADCWETAGGHCSGFACESPKKGELAPPNTFLDEITATSTSLDMILQGTPHQSEQQRYDGLRYAAHHGALNPSTVLRQMQDGLDTWRTYYKQRLEESCSPFPYYARVKQDPTILELKSQTVEEFCELEKLIPTIFHALEIKDPRPEIWTQLHNLPEITSKNHSANKRIFTWIGLIAFSIVGAVGNAPSLTYTLGSFALAGCGAGGLYGAATDMNTELRFSIEDQTRRIIPKINCIYRL